MKYIFFCFEDCVVPTKSGLLTWSACLQTFVKSFRIQSATASFSSRVDFFYIWCGHPKRVPMRRSRFWPNESAIFWQISNFCTLDVGSYTNTYVYNLRKPLAGANVKILEIFFRKIWGDIGNEWPHAQFQRWPQSIIYDIQPLCKNMKALSAWLTLVVVITSASRKKTVGLSLTGQKCLVEYFLGKYNLSVVQSA
jgi:hypothetical protein